MGHNQQRGTGSLRVTGFLCPGQDVSQVLDSSVAVDTSILEQYLSNDMDPSSL